MTLYRQLLFFTLFLFFVLFIGAWLVKLDSTRSFLQEQLISHAQDTATSLGVSLSQHMANDDLPAAETMINAVFDRGYYKVVRLEDINRKPLIERISEVAIKGVPHWFVAVVPLETPAAEATVMSGWRQVGMVYVKSHPGYAYKELWESVLYISVWFAVIALIVIPVGGIGLKLLLRPLQRVEQQADALCRKQYDIQENIPRTRELRRVVEAMNRMTCKVRDMFTEQVALAEGLRREAYCDQLTGLGNRRYFEGQIAAAIVDEGSAIRGALLICQIKDLQKVNNDRGFESGDMLLKQTAQILQDSAKTVSGRVLARLTGGDFGVLLPYVTPEVVRGLADDIMKRLAELASQKLTLSDNVGHIGIVLYDRSVTLRILLGEADIALRSAQRQGPNAWYLQELSRDVTMLPVGRQQWKKTLQDVIEQEKIFLYLQPVVDSNNRNRVLHQEIFSRIELNAGEIINAGVFIPMAEQNGIISSLDRIVMKKVFKLDKNVLQAEKIAVNISPVSLYDSSFKDWLIQSLQTLPEKGPRMIFEFAEFSAVQNIDEVKKFGDLVKRFGHDIGLDHFGQSFSNFGYLRSLRPEHVKIDGAFTAELKDEENDSRFFMGSLCSIAHSLDVAVIAEGVETEEQWERIKILNMDGVQGYLIGKPGSPGEST